MKEYKLILQNDIRIKMCFLNSCDVYYHDWVIFVCRHWISHCHASIQKRFGSLKECGCENCTMKTAHTRLSSAFPRNRFTIRQIVHDEYTFYTLLKVWGETDKKIQTHTHTHTHRTYVINSFRICCVFNGTLNWWISHLQQRQCQRWRKKDRRWQQT